MVMLLLSIDFPFPFWGFNARAIGPHSVFPPPSCDGKGGGGRYRQRSPHTREKLNTPEPTFPLGLLVCLLYLSVVCKPVQIFPCMGCVHGVDIRELPWRLEFEAVE
jgi:hypothetical protein